MPLVVLSHGLPPELPPDLEFPPGYPDLATLERASQAAQSELGRLLPYARHVIAKRSGHYIHNAQPKLVIDAVRRELRMVRPVAVRCRRGGNSCRARVGLAGGASEKRVAIELSDSNLGATQAPLPARRVRALREPSAKGGIAVRVQAQRGPVDPARLGADPYVSGCRRPVTLLARGRPTGGLSI